MPVRPREALLAALDSASADGDVPIALTVRVADTIDPLSLWDAFPDLTAQYWDAAGDTTVGIGDCLRVDASETSSRSFDRIRSAVRLSPGAESAPSPRLIGAVPFASGWTDDDWTPLTGHGFILPRWTIHQTAVGTFLQLAFCGSRDDGTRAKVAGELDRIEHHIDSADKDPDGWSGPGPAVIPHGQDAASWSRSVAAALDHIGAGLLEKVVLSRFVVHRFASQVAASTLLRRVRAAGIGRYRYGLRSGGSAFVGASPECLFEKRGGGIELEALAGTYDLGSDGSPDALVNATEHLFGSGKDLEEHALVVSGILNALDPIAHAVSAAQWPSVRAAAGGLAHLSTDLDARLRPGVTAFDLIAALHPTPAVGGLPASAALEFIRANEAAPRGLFASPVGWIDADGDASIAVGIRSALIAGDTARVYAGAGIVSGSEPDAEWRETEAKLRWLEDLREEEAGV